MQWLLVTALLGFFVSYIFLWKLLIQMNKELGRMGREMEDTKIQIVRLKIDLEDQEDQEPLKIYIPVVK